VAAALVGDGGLGGTGGSEGDGDGGVLVGAR